MLSNFGAESHNAVQPDEGLSVNQDTAKLSVSVPLVNSLMLRSQQGNKKASLLASHLLEWSLCGNYLYFQDGDSRVYRINTKQGSPPKIIWDGSGRYDIYSMRASLQGALLLSVRDKEQRGTTNKSSAISQRDTTSSPPKLIFIEKATTSHDETVEISLGSDFDFVWDLDFHPKWNHLVVFQAWSTFQSPMPWSWSKIVLYSLKTRKYKLIAGGKEMACAEPRFSPNGQRLSFLSDKNGRYGLYAVQISSREKVEKRETLIEPTEDFDLISQPSMTPHQSHYAWLDNNHIVYIRNEHGFCNLEMLEVDEQRSTSLLHNMDKEQLQRIQMSRPPSPPRSPSHMLRNEDTLNSATNGLTEQLLPRGVFTEITVPILSSLDNSLHFFCKYSAPNEPTKFLRVNATQNTYDIVSHSHAMLPNTLRQHLVTPLHFECETKDKSIVHGTLYVGTGGQSSAPQDLISLSGLNLPVITLIHDGPSEMHLVGYDALVQYFASRGYLIFCPNYRGSSGYGRAYRESLNGNFGNYDVEDCFEGLQYLLSLGIADGSKCIVAGVGSGGCTTLHLLNRYPEYFSAGIGIAPLLDLFEFRKSSCMLEKHKFDALIGPLPESGKQLRLQSPFNQTKNIETPLLILQGDQDSRCPVELAKKYVSKLEQQQVHAKLKVYEGVGNILSDSATLLDVLQRVDEFVVEQVIYS